MKRSILQRIKGSHAVLSAMRWIDNEAGLEQAGSQRRGGVDWLRVLPFVLLHVACIAVVWVGWSPAAVVVAAGLYLVRMFAITAFYHRYFSHRAFKTSRPFQFLFALLGNTTAERGPAWWASHHRHHHRFADREEDVHSPVIHGFLWSHVGWFTSLENYRTRWEFVRDWQAFPEIVWLNRFSIVGPAALAAAVYALGAALGVFAPGLGTNGPQMFVWGFCISTVVLAHATFTINSLDHLWGTRRYATPDQSRNNAFLALLTLGEGWHNNHHHYAGTARQGFYWWEIDVTWYVLKGMAWIGIIRDLRGLPRERLLANRLDQGSQGGTDRGAV